MENTDQIKEFSFQHILNIAKRSVTHPWVYEDKYMIFKFGEKQEDQNSEFLKYPTRIDASMCMITTDSDEDTIILCDMQEYHIRRNTFFYSRPGSILQAKTLSHAKGWGIISDPSFGINLNLSVSNLLPHISVLKQELALPVSDEQAQVLDSLCQTVTQIIPWKGIPYYQEIFISASTTIFYQFLSILASKVQTKGREEKNASREETYFKRFMLLLNENHLRERSVQFYAEQMNLSPKYLSAIVKKVTDRTPSDWIDGMVIMEAKNLLKFSEMNIQEIAYRLNFPNQSFFGKYFKQRAGMTPTEYRETK